MCGSRSLRTAERRCQSPMVRAEELDQLVWEEIRRLLCEPDLVRGEIDRRLRSMRETDPAARRSETLAAELTRADRAIARLVDAYQDEQITLDELRARMPELRRHEPALRAERDAIEAEIDDATNYLKLADTIEELHDPPHRRPRRHGHRPASAHPPAPRPRRPHRRRRRNGDSSPLNPAADRRREPRIAIAYSSSWRAFLSAFAAVGLCPTGKVRRLPLHTYPQLLGIARPLATAACDVARRPSNDRRAVWRCGQPRLRRAADRRSAVRPMAPTRRPLPSVDRCPRRCTTCGQMARRTRARRLARTRVGPKSRRPRARPRPRSRPPRVVRGTKSRIVQGVRCRGGHQRWATDVPTLRTPSRPTDRSSSRQEQRCPWRAAAAAPATDRPRRALRPDQLRSPAGLHGPGQE